MHLALTALVCVAGLLAAGCHRQSINSGYGITWVTLTDQPGDYKSYVVTIDSITLIRNDGDEFEALGTPEIVDLAALNNIEELWGSGSVPNGLYVKAIITLDYTSARIMVERGGLPVLATVLDAQTPSVTPTTYAISVDFDPANLLNISATYASTSAQRLAIDVNLAASGEVDYSPSVPIVYVRPYVTASVLTADEKPIRIRGPLINSSTDVNTYTVYVRPFYDEENNIGTVTMFASPATRFSINGSTYVGYNGLDQLSGLSAGTTMTAAYTQFVPDLNTVNGARAGRFNMLYVVVGSTLEDIYTEGISGDVIARVGNTVTLHGSTVFLNTADTFEYLEPDSTVLLGPATIVTADDNTTLTSLNYSDVAVGQHITVRGKYSLASDASTIIDATGATATNSGSVRLQSTEIFGSLVSAATGSAVIELETINGWPAGIYDFRGNGKTAAQSPPLDAFTIDAVSNAGTLSVPAGTAVGDGVWANGFFAPFGGAPPAFNAVALNNEASVQLAGTALGGGTPVAPAAIGPGTQNCGVGSQVCDPASLQITWSGTAKAGTDSPFATASRGAFTINLANKDLYSEVIRVGPEIIDLKSLHTSPTVVPSTSPITSTYAPRYSLGSPLTFTSTSTVTATTDLLIYSDFGELMDRIGATMTVSNPALQLAARGFYDRAANMFYATSIDFVL